MASIAIGIVAGLTALAAGTWASARLAIKLHNEDIDQLVEDLDDLQSIDTYGLFEVGDLKDRLQNQKI